MHDGHRLVALLGGPRGAVEAALPSIAFVTTYLGAGQRLSVALLVALAVGALLAAARAARRESLRTVLGGFAAVLLAAAVAARTGHAADFFLPSLLANLASAVAWAASIVAGWPLLGVVVGVVTRQGTAWRNDPDLLRAYRKASWIWTVSFLVRAGVMAPLYLSGNLVALAAAKVALGWPMVLLVIWASWWVIRAELPEGHPGMFRPLAVQRARAPRSRFGAGR